MTSPVSLKAVVMALLAHKTEPLTLTALCKVASATRTEMAIAVLSLEQSGDLRYHYPTDSCEAIKRGDALHAARHQADAACPSTAARRGCDPLGEKA